VSLLIASLLLAAELTPPPPPPPLVPAPLVPAPPPAETPLAETPRVPQVPRVYVSLLKVPQDTDLYDVTRGVRLCRAPCGVWLDSDADHKYQLQGDFRPSSDFSLQDFTPGVAVGIDFVPRDDGLFAMGLAFTIVGGVGIVAGLVSAVAWLYLNLILALFGGRGGFLFEMLYFAAAAVGVGIPGVAVGVPLLIKSRSVLDVREARPESETPLAR